MLPPSFDIRPLKKTLSDKLNRRGSSIATISPAQNNKWFNRRRSETEFQEDNELDLDDEEDGGEEDRNLNRRGSIMSQNTEGDQWFRVQHRYLPIVSGIICPFSVLLEIPGLTTRWYVKTEGYNVIETQPNPVILDVGLALSMLFGVLANIALIHRFLEKRVRISTIVSIACLSIHDLINITILITFGVVHRFNDGFTYGDSYWMTVAATEASLICNVTLIVDFVRTSDFNKNGSGLTEKQRSLVVAVMCLLCYIALGSLVFSFLLKLTYINSLYFTICTISSVGFGDITPNNLASRIFSLPYDIFGLVLLAFTIAQSRETIIETFEASYRHRRAILAAKARERKLEKKHRAKERQERKARELELLAKEKERGGATLGRTATNGTSFTLVNPVGHFGRGGAGGRMERELDMIEEKENGISTGKAWMNRFLRRFGIMKPLDSNVQALEEKEPELGITRTLTANSIVQEEKYTSFRKQIANEQKREFQIKIGVALSLFFVFWFVGAAVFALTEGWNYTVALYFCFICFTTIGYGDYAPQSPAGRAFFVAWSLLGIATMTLLLSVVTESWSTRYRSSITEGKVKQTIRRVKAAALSTDDITTRARVAARELLQVEGFEGEDKVDPRSFPTMLSDCIRAFHSHATYFMHGRTGDTPPALRGLIDAADEFQDELDGMQDEGALESGAHADTRHFLFMISYERSFDSLLDASERLSGIYASHAEELEIMKSLNKQLRRALREIDQEPGDFDDTIQYDVSPFKRKSGASSIPYPFSRRPPGGEGDEMVEENLIEEIDDEINQDDQPDNDDSKEIVCSSHVQGDKTPPPSPPQSDLELEGPEILPLPTRIQTARDTYHQSTNLMNKIQFSNSDPVKLLHPIPSSNSSNPSTPNRPVSNSNSISRRTSIEQFSNPFAPSPFSTSRSPDLSLTPVNTTSSQGSTSMYRSPSSFIGSPRTQALTFLEPEKLEGRSGENVGRRKGSLSGSSSYK